MRLFGHEHLIVLLQVSAAVFPPSQSRVKLAARSKFSKKAKEPRAIAFPQRSSLGLCCERGQFVDLTWCVVGT